MKKMPKRILLFLLLLFCQPIFSQEWQLADIMPLPVAGGRAIAHDSLIYLIGGYNDPSDIQNSMSTIIQTYNPQTGEWDSTAASLDVGRAGFAAGVYQDKVYWGGGVWDVTGQPFLFSVDSWDFADTLTSVQFNPEFGRTNTTGLVHNGALYMIGGSPVGAAPSGLAYIVEYDIENRTTETYSYIFGNNPPIQHMTAIIGDSIYIFGGYFNGLLSLTLRFDTVTKDFEVATTLRRERAGGAAVTVNDREIYLIGGFNENPNQTAMDSLTIYNVHNDDITAGPNLNWGRTDLMAVKHNSYVYVFGGFDENGNIVPIVERIAIITGIDDEISPLLSDGFQLNRNYPNPFNPSTTISYRIGRETGVKLTVYSILGEKVQTLVDYRQAPGEYQVRWDGRDDSGQLAGSGIYIYRLETDYYTAAEKMTLVR